jgi:hypothetical protein
MGDDDGKARAIADADTAAARLTGTTLKSQFAAERVKVIDKIQSPPADFHTSSPSRVESDL